VTQDIHHAIDDLLAFGTVFHIFHSVEQPVILRTGIIGGVLAFVAVLETCLWR